MRVFGIETEYGITRDDLHVVDPVVESMELVRAHVAGSFEKTAVDVFDRKHDGSVAVPVGKVRRITHGNGGDDCRFVQKPRDYGNALAGL